jgi:hypothetical protein
MRAAASTQTLGTALYFLFVLGERRVAFKDKRSFGVDAAVSPHPNPLPMGEGEKKLPEKD